MDVTGRARDALAAVRPAALRAVRAVRAYRPRHGWWVATGLVVAGLLVSVVVGVTTASVRGSLGPHVTRYDVTSDKTVTIDFGPLGTLQIDSPLPFTLGVRATVQEIPADVTELGQARTLQALSEDLSSYLAFFSGPAAAVQDVAQALVRDAIARSALTFVLLVVVWWGGALLLGPERRRQLAAPIARHARQIGAGALTVVLGGTVLTSSLAPQDRPEPPRTATAVFEGTPLAGARVTGRLGGVIDTYGTYAVDAWRQNEEFYRSANEALVVAWDEWVAEEERLVRAEEQRRAALADDDATPTTSPTAGTDGETDGAGTGAGAEGEVGADDAAGDDAGTDGAADGAADGTSGDATAEGTSDEATAEGTSDDATASPSPTPTPTPEIDPVVLLVVSDLHCNVGMAPLIGTLARLSGAEVVLDAGDTTMNGTSVEQYCVTSFARAVPDGVQIVVSPGNHDSEETSANYARAGATVLDGKVVEVAGVRILGDRDARATRVGAGGTAVASEETPSEAAQRLADVACEDGDVDLLLIHTPAAGQPALEEGCVPAQVSGHFHTRSGPEQVGLGVRYVSASTAGATLNQPTVGPLRGVAEMTVLRFDRASRRLLDHQVVRVTPQATVSVGRPRPWPLVAVPPEGEDVDATASPTATPTATVPGTATPEG